MSRSAALLEADVRSVPALVEAKRSAVDALRFRTQVREMANWTTVDLLPRLETTQDPLMLWALHLELERRDIPPCLRIPMHSLGPQGDYITLVADLLWFQKRNPKHQAVFRGWRDVLRARLCSAQWHQHVYRQFLYNYPRGLSYMAAKGLGLMEAQRQQLLSMPTSRMARERMGVQGDAFARLIDKLQQHALAHPDRAGKHPPHVVALRRARLLRCHVMSGSSPTLTAEYWRRMTGEKLSRQAISAHVESARHRGR